MSAASFFADLNSGVSREVHKEPPPPTPLEGYAFKTCSISMKDILMPLYIKDPDVDKLVDRYLAASGAKTKTGAVRAALLHSIAALEKQETLVERVAKVQRKAAEAGLGPRETNDKPFMDELWGED